MDRFKASLNSLQKKHDELKNLLYNLDKTQVQMQDKTEKYDF